MELRVLRYFLTVAREENITRAAELLHITQPTLSRQLMQLEEELGVTLFKRSRYRIVLTEDGELLRRRAQEIVELSDKAERELKHEEEIISGEIAIGSGDLLGGRFLTDVMQRFQTAHPLVTYSMFSCHSDLIKERLDKGLLDFGLLVEPVDITRYDFIRLPVREHWCVMVREDSELAGKPAVSAGELVKYPLVMPYRESVQNEIRNWFGPWADQMVIRATGNLPNNMANMVRSGIGVSVNVMLGNTYEGIRLIPLEPDFTVWTVLVWKKTNAVSPAVKEFIRFFKNSVQA